MITLVLGGARSGKSVFAERLAAQRASRPDTVTYVATARPFISPDPDFDERIRAHRARRPSPWHTEDEEDLVPYLAHPSGLSLVDDLGTWLTHRFDVTSWDEPPQQAIDELIAALTALPSTSDIILVSPEVGLSVVPEHRSARLFRDTCGLMNSRVAECAHEVFFVAAGLPLKLKPATPLT